jgi:apolipoprotein N-acyltransferase
MRKDSMTPRVFLPALLSGLLLWPAFFPYDFGLVAFVALAPLATLVRAEGVKWWRRYLAAYLGGLTFFLIALNWVRVAHDMMALAWIGLSLMGALYWPLAIVLLRLIDRRWKPSLSITFPVVWVALEYVRAHFPTGFPALELIGCYRPVGFAWYFLGHAMHGSVPFIQIADITGVYGVSFAIASMNGAAAEWLLRLDVPRKWLLGLPPDTATRGWMRAFRATAIAAAMVAVTTCYGFFSIIHPAYEKGPRVAAIQADIPQNEKTLNIERVYQRYDQLARSAAPKADLVVWPETCFPAGWYGLRNGASWDTAPEGLEKDARFVPDRVRQLMTGPNGWKTPMLLGTSTYDWDGQKEIRGNSAVLIDREGVEAGRYDKIHLVPFGEYVPFRETLPVMKKFTPYGDREYSCTPGEQFTRFPLMVGDRQFTFGVIICYEDSDPTICRPYVRKGPDGEPVDFLVNISNDGWFLGTEQHEQHLAVCRFRAVETRRSIVRAVNMGISAIIDPDGRVIALPGDDWRTSKRIDGTVTDYVPISHTSSIYSRFGDWFPLGCGLVILALWYLSRPRKQP